MKEQFTNCHFPAGYISDEQKQARELLKRGMQQWTKGTTANYPCCPICNKEFQTVGNLKMHLLIHSGVKPFMCKECNKQFTRKHHLQQHIISLHGIKKLQELTVKLDKDLGT